MLTLVLGGTRSGKSRHAEALVMAHPGPWIYVATAQAWDAEMAARIAEHAARRGPGWETVEAPLDLAPALARPGPLMVDCLTLWLTNRMLAGLDHALVIERADPTVLVASEVGLGIVPDNALARRFRDAAGLLHQAVAARADRVILMVAGIPMVVR